MKALLLMWSDGSYAGGDAEEDFAAWATYEETLRADGALLDSGVFADAGRAIVTSISQPPESTPELSTRLAGFYLIDVDDLEVAADLARRAPLYGTVEVRPLLNA